MFAAVMLPPTMGANTALMTPYRPARPSPLSSSPLRAPPPAQNPPSSPPSIFGRPSAIFPDTQSSPVQPSASLPSAPSFSSPPSVENSSNSTQKLLRFASRQAKAPPRPNRDATRQTRRSLFLRNVRQRADDQVWDRRNCEQELQKLEWWSLERDIRQAREADTLSMLTEHDFDDAAAGVEHPSSFASYAVPPSYGDYDDMDEDQDPDERIVDTLARQEEAEMEALIASMDANRQQQQPRKDGQAPSRHSIAFSDDSDYDTLFAELLSQQPGEAASSVPMSEDTDMS